jgi:tetraacyldisaccharide 4'-kinase
LNVQAFWSRKRFLNFLLLPVSALFGAVVALRRWLYRKGLLFSAHPGVPVIVVGNLTAGGSGKTPFVIWLVQWLQAKGFRPGVVSRGYGRQDRSVRCVTYSSMAAEVGDEPLLVHLKTGVPVAVGADRLAAARLLLARHPGVDVIVSDDGLQHYRMRRNLELVLADAQTVFGNGWLLPAGPLREPVSRIEQADALILTERKGQAGKMAAEIPQFTVRHEPAGYQNLANGVHAAALPDRQGRQVQAVTGIARPEEFFNLLASLHINHHPRAYPDHYQFKASDLDASAVVVMTEKDAVKCKAFAGPDWWSLQLKVTPAPELEDWLTGRLGTF